MVKTALIILGKFMTEHSICVFCGARSGTDPAYQAAAQAFGRAMATENWQLVYGAGDVGLMGAVARAAQAEGALLHIRRCMRRTALEL